MKHSFPALVLPLLVASCGPSEEAPPSQAGPGEAPMEETAPGTMNVVATALTFDAPDEIPAGWTTIRFVNQSPMTHFVLVEHFPEGQGVATQQEQVAPIFQAGMDSLAVGEVDGAMARFGEIPPWFGEIVFTGGPGLTAPNRVSEATVFLEPGTYVLECYVKTEGIFHSFNPDPNTYGMVHELTVTADTSDVPEPVATVHIEISSTDGIQVQGEPRVGEQTVSVHFLDQIVYENFGGHDVHVVRLSEGADLEALEGWMDWTAPEGLQIPAPAEFIGGLNDMPAGATGYFDVTLEPGRYAWVSEVPGTLERGLLREFRVQ
jgi:hypothetical protein